MANFKFNINENIKNKNIDIKILDREYRTDNKGIKFKYTKGGEVS